MKNTALQFSLVFLLIAFCWGNAPFLSLSRNGSISFAVVFDQEYLRRIEGNTLENIKELIDRTVRASFKNIKVNVRIYTWSAFQFKKDFVSIITIAGCEKTWTFLLRRYSSVLLIAITEPNCPRSPIDQAVIIPVVIGDQEFPQMLLDARKQNILTGKTNMFVLDMSVLNEKKQILESFFHTKKKFEISPVSLYLKAINTTLKDQQKRKAISEALVPFSKSDQHNKFLVFSEQPDDIIEIAEALNLFSIYNQWLFVIIGIGSESFDPVSLTQHLNHGANIAFAINHTLSICQHTSISVLATVSNALSHTLCELVQWEEALFGKISDEEWQAIRRTNKEQHHLAIGYMREHLKKDSSSACLRWNIKSAISWSETQTKKRKSGQKKKLKFIDVGFWSPIVGFDMTDFIFPHMKHKLRNVTLDILTYHNPPWQNVRLDHNGMISSASGIVIDLLNELSRKLNFTYNLVNSKTSREVGENLFDSLATTLPGSMTFNVPDEIVEMLQGEQVFMAAVASTIDDPKEKPFNFTIPISIQKYSFITKRPDEFSRIYLFTAPFKVQTWTSLIAVIVLMAPLLYVISVLAPTEQLRSPGLCSLRNCYWHVYGALLQQGGMYLPKADSGRIIIGSWWIVVTVLITTYCGNLVAFLTFPRFHPEIEYLNQSFQHKNIKQFGLRNGSYFEKYCKYSNREDLKMFLNKAVIYSDSITEGMASVEKGNRLNIDWRINLQLTIQKKFEEDQNCNLGLGKESFVEERVGLIMPKNSPYIQLVNDEIKNLFQMGFIEHWHKKHLPSAVNKCDAKHYLRRITNHKVNLDDMQGCFLVLLFGFTLAMISILIECSYHRFYKTRNENLKFQYIC